MASKADQLGPTPAFGAPRRAKSARGQLIEEVTGAAGAEETALAIVAGAPIIDLDRIAFNPFNPRETLPQEEVKATADSLLERGQVQPVTAVTRETWLKAHPATEATIGDAPYVLVDGNIRKAAAHLAGLEGLRTDVNDSLGETAEDMLESALVSNIRRALMDPVDEARALKALVDKYGSARGVARRVGRAHTWINQRLELLALVPEVVAKLRAGEATLEDARGLGKVEPADQLTALQTAIDKRTHRNEERRVKSTTSFEQSVGNGASTKTGSPVQGTEPEGGVTEDGNGASTPHPVPVSGADPRPSPELPVHRVALKSVRNVTPPKPSDAMRKPGAAQEVSGSAVSTPGQLSVDEWNNIPYLAALIRARVQADKLPLLAQLLASAHSA